MQNQNQNFASPKMRRPNIYGAKRTAVIGAEGAVELYPSRRQARKAASDARRAGFKISGIVVTEQAAPTPKIKLLNA